MQTEKRAGVGRNVVVKIGRLPLIGNQKVQATVTVHVGERNAPADHRLGEADLGTDVVKTSIGGAHKKRIQVVLAAQVRARLEARPQTRVMDNAGIARAKRLQFRPAIYFSLDEADGLYRLEHAAVVQIGEAAIPAPAAAREAELFARLNEWRDAVFHVVELAGVLPEKMTFAQGELVRDVTD